MTNTLDEAQAEASRWRRARRFLLHEVWALDLSSLSRKKGVLVRFLRVGQLVVKGFREDDLPLRASALTLTCLMSLVPLLAFSFSVLKGLGAGETAFAQLRARIGNMPTQLAELQQFLLQLLTRLEDTSFFALGGVAVLLLLFMVIKLMSNIESAFNLVWGVATSRTILRKVADYTGTLVFIMVLTAAVLAGGATFSLESIVARFEAVPLIPEGLVSTLLPVVKLSMFFVTWLGFGLLYVFMPNTRVEVKPAAVSGAVTAVLWMIWQRLFFSAQVSVFRYNDFYGIFAAVPVFLIWLYVCWVIVLLGAEIAFAVQNYSTYQLERAAGQASLHSKLLLALSLVRRASDSLLNGAEPLEAAQFAKERGVSFRLVNEVLNVLEHEGLIGEMAGNERRYVMLRAPERVRVKEVLDLFLQEGGHPEQLGLNHLDETTRAVLARVDQGVDTALDALTVRDLLTKAS